ncbi:MAG: rhomboid family intramembrane serine protease [Bacteroidetes bacterium]|nr:rhomboid family intramembrane serine protease [Bacteroidota bacterium]
MEPSQNPLDKIITFFRNQSALSNLILINIVVFLFIQVVNLLFWLMKFSPGEQYSFISLPAYWLSVPADPSRLLFRPWGIFTYMFTHEDFMHILFNMITLYFGGQLFSYLLNDKKLVSTYLLGGLSGAVFFIISYNIFPVFEDVSQMAFAIGASAAVLAVLIAAATYAPDFEVSLFFIGKVKLKYIALIFVLLDLISISKDNPGGHISHLGGAAWGFLYVRFFLGKGLKTNPLSRLFVRSSSRKHPFRKKYVSKRPVSDEDFNKQRNEKQAKIDAILDKIAKTGYEGLTTDEKDTLFNARKK